MSKFKNLLAAPAKASACSDEDLRQTNVVRSAVLSPHLLIELDVSVVVEEAFLHSRLGQHGFTPLGHFGEGGQRDVDVEFSQHRVALHPRPQHEVHIGQVFTCLV